MSKYKLTIFSINYNNLFYYSFVKKLISPEGFQPPINSLTSVFLLKLITVKFYPIALAINPKVYVFPIPVLAINSGFSLFYKDIITFSIKLFV